MTAPVPASAVPERVEAHLRSAEPALLDEVGAAADDATTAVAPSGEAAGDPGEAADPPAALERRLRERGVLDRLPAVLSSAVEATGRTLRATPVAAPPYVVVAGEGPLLRATLSDGRLVVGLRVFAVRPGPTYVRRPGVDVEAALR